jgi:hypothetical protein
LQARHAAGARGRDRRRLPGNARFPHRNNVGGADDEALAGGMKGNGLRGGAMRSQRGRFPPGDGVPEVSVNRPRRQSPSAVRPGRSQCP